MKRIMIVTLLLTLIVRPAQANFYAGLAAAFPLHEAGHQVTAISLNESIDWRLTGDTRVVTARFSDDAYAEDLVYMASGGIVAQHVTNEILLEYESNDFRRGLFWGNILIPVVYALDHLFIHKLSKISHGVAMGDYAVIDDNCGQADVMAYTSLGIAAWQALRMYKNEYMPCYVWAEPGYIELIWEIEF